MAWLFGYNSRKNSSSINLLVLTTLTGLMTHLAWALLALCTLYDDDVINICTGSYNSSFCVSMVCYSHKN